MLLQCSQHCSHLGNDCPIIIVKGEADGEYRCRVLAHIVYFALQCIICGYCTIHGYGAIQGMYDIV
jgi:hypothetical protein